MSTEKSRKFPETSAQIDAETPYPPASAVVAGLKALRRKPLASEQVRQRVELLCVPFIRSLDDPAEHFIKGAKIITESFTPTEQLVLDYVLFRPSTEGVGKRRDEVLIELTQKELLRSEASARAITHIEDKALRRLAEALGEICETHSLAL